MHSGGINILVFKKKGFKKRYTVNLCANKFCAMLKILSDCLWNIYRFRAFVPTDAGEGIKTEHIGVGLNEKCTMWI